MGARLPEQLSARYPPDPGVTSKSCRGGQARPGQAAARLTWDEERRHLGCSQRQAAEQRRGRDSGGGRCSSGGGRGRAGRARQPGRGASGLQCGDAGGCKRLRGPRRSSTAGRGSSGGCGGRGGAPGACNRHTLSGDEGSELPGVGGLHRHALAVCQEDRQVPAGRGQQSLGAEAARVGTAAGGRGRARGTTCGGG